MSLSIDEPLNDIRGGDGVLLGIVLLLGGLEEAVAESSGGFLAGQGTFFGVGLAIGLVISLALHCGGGIEIRGRKTAIGFKLARVAIGVFRFFSFLFVFDKAVRGDQATRSGHHREDLSVLRSYPWIHPGFEFSIEVSMDVFIDCGERS